MDRVTGRVAGRRFGASTRGRWRAGALLIARGEFSIIIAEIGVEAGLEPQLAPLATAVVFSLAVLGPMAVHIAGTAHRHKLTNPIGSQR